MRFRSQQSYLSTTIFLILPVALMLIFQNCAEPLTATRQPLPSIVEPVAIDEDDFGLNCLIDPVPECPGYQEPLVIYQPAVPVEADLSVSSSSCGQDQVVPVNSDVFGGMGCCTVTGTTSVDYFIKESGNIDKCYPVTANCSFNNYSGKKEYIKYINKDTEDEELIDDYSACQFEYSPDQLPKIFGIRNKGLTINETRGENLFRSVLYFPKIGQTGQLLGLEFDTSDSAITKLSGSASAIIGTQNISNISGTISGSGDVFSAQYRSQQAKLEFQSENLSPQYLNTFIPQLSLDGYFETTENNCAGFFIGIFSPNLTSLQGVVYESEDKPSNVLCYFYSENFGSEVSAISSITLINLSEFKKSDFAAQIDDQFQLTIVNRDGAVIGGGKMNYIPEVFDGSDQDIEIGRCSDKSHNGGFSLSATIEDDIRIKDGNSTFELCDNGEIATHIVKGTDSLTWKCGMPDDCFPDEDDPNPESFVAPESCKDAGDSCSAVLGAPVCGTYHIENTTSSRSSLPSPEDRPEAFCGPGSSFAGWPPSQFADVQNPQLVLGSRETKNFCDIQLLDSNNSCASTELNTPCKNERDENGCVRGVYVSAQFGWSCQLDSEPSNTTNCLSNYSSASDPQLDCLVKASHAVTVETKETFNVYALPVNGPDSGLWQCFLDMEPVSDYNYNLTDVSSMEYALKFVRQILNQTNDTQSLGTGKCNERKKRKWYKRIGRSKYKNYSKDCPLNLKGPRPLIDEEDHKSPDMLCKSFSPGWSINPSRMSTLDLNPGCDAPIFTSQNNKVVTHWSKGTLSPQLPVVIKCGANDVNRFVVKNSCKLE